MQVRRIGKALGAEIKGIDLTAPLSSSSLETIEHAFTENLVLVFRDQVFGSADNFIKAAQKLGDPMPPVTATYRLAGYDVVEELVNKPFDKRSGKKIDPRGGSWHTDHSNLPQPPKATSLYAIEIPPSGGGQTEFTNMYMAYETLPADLKKRIKGKKSFQAYQARRAPRQLLTRSDDELENSSGTWQPLVRLHPQSKRKTLYLNPMRNDEIEGYSQEEGDSLLDQLYAHADSPEFQYSHEWKSGDMLIWDNRCTLHQATALRNPEERRYMHRIMLKGDVPILAD
ncbi:MAG: TauD/TfdA dioxygenase family protein [Methyloligellaceae bacterium]